MTNKNREITHSPVATVRAKPGRKGLGRRHVLDAARGLCDANGIEHLSIKELAERLGIRPPSVYAHFQGLGEIRRELALWGHRALAERLKECAIGLSGPDALFALGHAYLAFIRQEPGLYSATVATPARDDQELHAAADDWIGVFFTVLRTFDLSADDTVHAIRGVRSIVHGFGSLEAHGAFITALDRDASFDKMLRSLVQSIAEQQAAGRKRR